MQMPAFCRECGNPFPSGFEIADGVSGTVFEGSTAGPCPWCGGTGAIPNGSYDFIDGTLRVLRSSAFDRARLEALQHIARGSDPTTAVEALRREAPELEPYLARIINDPNALAAWLALLVSVIALALRG